MASIPPLDDAGDDRTGDQRRHQTQREHAADGGGRTADVEDEDHQRQRHHPVADAGDELAERQAAEPVAPKQCPDALTGFDDCVDRHATILPNYGADWRK